MNDAPARWPNSWVRAALDLALLGTLHGGGLHGYAVAARLEESGMGRLKGGSLYPALARLEEAGLVETVWLPGDSGPGRKAYTLTAAGEAERVRLAESWASLTGALTALAAPATTGDQS